MSRFSAFIKKMSDAINPALPVGGLEISDAFLRYAIIEDGQLRTAYARLAPGIVKDGHVAERAKFLEVLKTLKAQLGENGPANVIATVRSGSIYAQIFNLPPLPPTRRAEAVSLNLQSISPLERSTSYSDAEIVGEGPSGELEFLGAFAPRAVIDDLNSALLEAGFLPLAFEFGALSVARVIRELSGYGPEAPRLIINIMSDGVDFMIIKNSNLYFHYWSSWESVLGEGGRQIDLTTFNQLIYRETARLLQFYGSKWGGSIANAIVVAPGFPEESSRLLAESFGLKVESLSVKKFNELGAQWLGALGAALRGSVPRFKDVFISLAPVGTETWFAESRLLHFIRLWRNIIFSSAVFLLVIFISGLGILARVESNLRSEGAGGVAPELLAEVTALENEAKAFNSRVALVLAAKGESTRVSGLFNELQRVSIGRATLLGLTLDVQGGSIRVSGRAPSEVSAIGFKNALGNNPNFTEVSLPFANIQAQPDGSVLFQLTMRRASSPQ
jgi:Tfp pilus assembly protein PilN